MRLHYKVRDLLKDLPFYSEKINNIKKTRKVLLIINFYQNYHFFIKKLKF